VTRTNLVDIQIRDCLVADLVLGRLILVMVKVAQIILVIALLGLVVVL
jgi:hypothetical protein